MKELSLIGWLFLTALGIAWGVDWYIRAGLQGHTISPSIAYDRNAEIEHELSKIPRGSRIH